jgi:hypothetical protein
MNLPTEGIYVILEDDMRRMIFFNTIFEQNNIDFIHFETAPECVKYIEDNKDTISFFFLDHDLGGLIMVDSKELNTGYTVAKAIHRIYGDNHPPAVIHSLNPAGARNMHKELPNSIEIPFIYLQAQMRGI